jgi:hypothetical protein
MHVLGEGLDPEGVLNLGAGDEGARPLPANDMAISSEVIQGTPESLSGDPEVRAQFTFRGELVSGLERLDHLEEPQLGLFVFRDQRRLPP